MDAFPPEAFKNPDLLFSFAKERIAMLLGNARQRPERSMEIFAAVEELALTVADRFNDSRRGTEFLDSVEEAQRSFFSYDARISSAENAEDAQQASRPRLSIMLHGKAERTLEDLRISQPRLYRAYQEWKRLLEKYGYPEAMDSPEYAHFHDHKLNQDSRRRSIRLSDRDRLIYTFRNGTVYVGGIIRGHEYDTELPKINARMEAMGI